MGLDDKINALFFNKKKRPEQERLYPAIREVFHLSDGIPSKTLSQILPAVPEDIPVSEIARLRYERVKPLTEEEVVAIIKVVLRWTEEYWGNEFHSIGLTYKEPMLVLFTDRTETPCGMASPQTGPFFCPLDEKIYIDPAFYNEIANNYLAISNETSMAYIIFHEISHTVQNQLGIMKKVNQMKGLSTSLAEKNRLTMALEIHADYLAGCTMRTINEKKYYLARG